MSRLVAVIPARGGSKGIPRKNLLEIAGKPLIAWTIESALEVLNLRVIVSTEDDEIAEVATLYGAEVIKRPVELAQDATATEPVVRHVIDTLTQQAERPDTVMLLQATSPVRLPGTLARAVDEFTRAGADSMVGVVSAPPFIWRNAPHVAAEYDYEHRPRRQDMTPEQLRYRETGSVYLTRTDIYEQCDNRLGGQVALFVMNDVEGTDIDTRHDFATAEQILLGLQAATGDRKDNA
ncbi:acylneuraminate cytidylyltransferase family protein [Aestuariimicrobium sp. p3-SID1156]|uniref:acylneuraminate cytidylyltransferase family protein n=1 Tax=Aestuariimicrobium sp. p3-SID1156 TaxID=2916038 RepID=UPI00223AB070|nr:acylneuraminate cytidylyltransferase family protein [Aestuariimicrobium sp. p3-SID1156]MCT1458277.1 acylneuraminate cytidylyltransferase family protein [Aestuariimicrobium sp. p3-SID1156]